MPRQSPLPQSSHHILLYDEDWEWLQRYYGVNNHPNRLGASAAIREIVHDKIKERRALQEIAVDSLETAS